MTLNVTLYGWTFNFHKVVRQQNSGAVKDFILLYSAVHLRSQKWTVHICQSYRKNKSGTFFLMAHGVETKTVVSNCFIHNT